MSLKLRMNGKLYGYPECCIDQFCTKPSGLTEVERKVGEGSGFIPCPKHVNMILNGDIKLSNIIQNRTFPEPFPIHKICDYTNR